MSDFIKVSQNSRAIRPGETFVAIKGHTVDGHNYIESAIEAGATRIVCEHGEYPVETVVVENSEKWLNDYLVENHSEELRDMKFIGITGTNGKTTTAFLTSQLLSGLGVDNAYIGTIGLYYNGEKVRDLPNTTPDILSMYNILLEVKSMGAKVVVMEVSSHALYYGRINGIKFDVAAFTNLTEDHLDFHKTMEAYLESKTLIKNYMNPDAVMVANCDDPYWKAFETAHTETVGIGTGTFNITEFEYGTVSTDITFQHNGETYKVTTNLLSQFNLYNYLMALAMTNGLGYAVSDIIEVTPDVYPPKGRNEIIPVRGGKAVIDYAHTPDAVMQIIKAYIEDKQGRVITIVGCGGDRDPIKRPIMGKIASDLSDYVIYTTDNPRTEDPELIMADILKGPEKDNYEVVIDRASAIARGVQMIEDGDTLLILGKGHEEYQILGREKIHFSDKEQVLKNL